MDSIDNLESEEKLWGHLESVLSEIKRLERGDIQFDDVRLIKLLATFVMFLYLRRKIESM
jgi:hypothetical protein